MANLTILLSMYERGGITRSALELYQEMSNSYETELLYFDIEREFGDIKRPGTLLRTGRQKKYKYKAILFIQRYRQLRKYGRKKDLGTVICFDPSSTLLAWIYKNTTLTFNIIAMCHVSNSLLTWIDKVIIKGIFPKIDRVVVPSKFIKDQMQVINKRLSPQVIPNILPERFYKSSWPRGEATDGSQFIFLGRLEPEKNPLFILQMAARDAFSRYLIFGNGSLESVCLKFIDDHRLKNVTLAGYQVSIDAFRHASILIIPSYVESFGIVALEAWSQGIPVLVSSYSDGVVEMMVDSQQGIVKNLDDDISEWVSAAHLLSRTPLSSQVITAIFEKYHASAIGELWQKNISPEVSA
jgi:glycosyltransferase involved in cell wall biosynthesis